MPGVCLSCPTTPLGLDGHDRLHCPDSGLAKASQESHQFPQLSDDLALLASPCQSAISWTPVSWSAQYFPQKGSQPQSCPLQCTLASSLFPLTQDLLSPITCPASCAASPPPPDPSLRHSKPLWQSFQLSALSYRQVSAGERSRCLELAPVTHARRGTLGPLSGARLFSWTLHLAVWLGIENCLPRARFLLNSRVSHGS